MSTSLRILVVDADERSRRVLELGLRKEGLDVVAVGSVAAGRDAGTGFDAVVVDAQLGDGEAAAWVTSAATRPCLAAVALVANSTSASDRDALVGAGFQAVVDRGARPRDVAAAIRAAAAASPAPAASGSSESGSLADRSLLEIVTDVEMAGASGVLTIKTAAVEGTVSFVNGAAFAASAGELSGTWAFAVLTIPEDGEWVLSSEPPSGPANLSGSLGSVLDAALADARRLGEAVAGLPALEGPAPVDPDRVADLEPSLSSAEWAIVQAAMGSGTVLGALVAAGGDPLTTAATLRVLAARGIYGAASSSAGDRARAELSRAQEAARLAAEEAARAEAEARRIHEEHERARAEEEARRRVEEEARLRAAEEARRKAEEARRLAEAIAEEEERRKAEEARRLAEQELARLQAEMDAIEAERRRDVEAAEAEAERIRREAEAAASALRQQADERARELEQKERELRARRVTLTGTLSAIGAPPSDAMAAERRALAAERVEALSTPAERPAAVEAAVQREMAALRMEQQAGGTALLEATGAATLGMHAAPAAAPASATPAASAAPGDSAVLADSFFAADPAGTDADLFAEPESSGPNATKWAFILVAILVGIVLVVLIGGGRGTPEPTPAPAVTPPAAPAAAAEASGPDPAAVEAAAREAAERLAEQQRVDAEINGQLHGENVAAEASGLVGEASGEPAPEPVAAVPAAPSEPRTPREPREPRERDEEPPSDPEPRGGRDADRLVTRCANTYNGGNYSETLTVCGEAVAANPRGAEALLYLGRAHYELGNSREAVRYLERAFAIDSRGQNVLLALGAARQDLGDNAGARTVYERFLELHPESRRAPEVRAILESL